MFTSITTMAAAATAMMAPLALAAVLATATPAVSERCTCHERAVAERHQAASSALSGYALQ